MWYPGFVDPRGLLDMQFLLYAEERSHVRRLLALVRRFGEGACFNVIDLCCRNGPFDRFYVVEDAEHWWVELDFEVSQKSFSLNAQFSG